MFFLQHDILSTPRCERTTTSPRFEITFRVTQTITEDFLVYLERGALELQVRLTDPHMHDENSRPGESKRLSDLLCNFQTQFLYYVPSL